MNKRIIDTVTDKSKFVSGIKEKLNSTLFNKLRGMKKEVASTIFPEKKDK